MSLRLLIASFPCLSESFGTGSSVIMLSILALSSMKAKAIRIWTWKNGTLTLKMVNLKSSHQIGAFEDEIDYKLDYIGDKRPRKIVRTLRMNIKIKGLPFYSSSLCLIKYYCRKKSNFLEINKKMQTPYVPLGNQK